MNKIKLKDYISWGIGILGIIVAIILGIKNRQLENKQQLIYNYAKNIQQNNYYYNLPGIIREQVDKIAAATSDVVSNNVLKQKK